MTNNYIMSMGNYKQYFLIFFGYTAFPNHFYAHLFVFCVVVLPRSLTE